ncbi:hypothetical protein [Neptunomonas sp.]|uniref:hypothetical protein n=1 Tax=Neptunomonas sp. TaxID=1971898 RepID=UPI0025E6F3B6|nr:hypothetical protein [Neptunomonas sp.]
MKLIKLLVGAALIWLGIERIAIEYGDVVGWVLLAIGVSIIFSVFSSGKSSSWGSSGDSDWGDSGGGDCGGGD